MSDEKDDELDDVDIEGKDREILEGYETKVETAKEGAIKPLAPPDPLAAPPLPTEARPEASPEQFAAEALAAGEPATPPPPGRQQISQSYWSLVWWKFRKNRLAIVGGILILTFYLVCVVFPEFFAPYSAARESPFLEAPLTRPHFFDAEGNFHLRPFVYGLEGEIDQATRTRTFTIDTTKQYPIHFLVPAEEYKLLGLIPMKRHLFGTDPNDSEANIFMMGTDRLGRDFFSRIIHGGRISLTIGLVGVSMTLFLGTVLGAVSGYYGGVVDTIIQRTTEFLTAFPREPLFLALAAAIPVDWPHTRTFFMITFLLAFISWGGLARQVRSLVLSGRENQYVLAAQSFGASDRRIIFRHLIPSTMSHVIVISTLAIPGMILLETALSFLGLGLQAPVVSWGVLLNEGGTLRAIRFAPHLLLIVPFIIVAVLAFNMLGDGLRDAMDPYSGR
ncbi:MAG: ABC transporter permease [Chloroflexi bacterium]|nr:ABC transporter permease [Chloroflexota bacterium]MCI0579693.1 ABC transporter permease [Chloroflexota bacterium]MCI0649580.1 ABC transporter permease [Chloroflexota bacterium]MCI0729344.1 ABC transporter permease [Chloroflexota bacterium]